MTVRKIKSIGDIPYPIDVGTDALSPLLTAGAALGITGDGPTETAAWLQRTSTSDGPTMVKSIHGRTVRWNQLAARRFTNVKVSNGVSFDYTQEGVISISGAATANVSFALIPNTATVVGHKYFVRAQVEGATIDSTSGYAVYLSPSTAFSGNMRMPAEGRIYTSTEVRDDANLIFSAPNGTTFSDALHSRPQFFDLTAMFGAGNEPSTVAEFEALYPESYYPYDAGSLLPVQMEGIATEDANGDPLAQRTIDVAAYFPDGMRSAGTVYDELTDTQAITRIGEVDLGTLTWTYTSGDHSRLTASLTDAQVPAGGSAKANIICPAYETVTSTEVYNHTADKVIALHTTQQAVWVYDSAYTDAATFKTAMSGVMLHYALATPTTVTIDPPLNMSYRTEQGGTERIMVPTGEQSAPPTIAAAQGYTAESLRDAALATIAPVENGLASTNYGVGSYLVHGGQLCKVTTAIATGEAITIGTNVTATTVMAEVIALTQ